MEDVYKKIEELKSKTLFMVSQNHVTGAYANTIVSDLNKLTALIETNQHDDDMQDKADASREEWAREN